MKPARSPDCSLTCANSNASSNLAVLLVHHARKDSHSSRPGQALRGSSELHGWGDSNLYMRCKGSQLTLSTEHRTAPGRGHLPLQLTRSASALALTVLELSTVEIGLDRHAAMLVLTKLKSEGDWYGFHRPRFDAPGSGDYKWSAE
jgi:hypothetical protein